MANRSVACADWDAALLALEIADLQALNYDISLTGFEDDELAKMLAAQEPTEGLTDEDAVPDLTQNPVTVSSDLWILGDHRLLCGDATKQSDMIG